MSKQQEALRLALEALESLVFNKPFTHRYGDVITALREAPAEQPAQQKPAFYRQEDGHLMTPDRAKFLGFDLNDLQALYTSPPAQRKPLTLQELEAAWNAQADKFNQWDELGLDEIVAWAQAAHKIKENT